MEWWQVLLISFIVGKLIRYAYNYYKKDDEKKL